MILTGDVVFENDEILFYFIFSYILYELIYILNCVVEFKQNLYFPLMDCVCIERKPESIPPQGLLFMSHFFFQS